MRWLPARRSQAEASTRARGALPTLREQTSESALHRLTIVLRKPQTPNPHLAAAWPGLTCARLGVTFDGTRPGAVVESIHPGSLLWRAGLMHGDCVHSIGGERMLASPAELSRALPSLVSLSHMPTRRRSAALRNGR